MSVDDAQYFTVRARVERELARRASIPNVINIHNALADEYEKRARRFSPAASANEPTLSAVLGESAERA